jgi:hypothetical protein
MNRILFSTAVGACFLFASHAAFAQAVLEIPADQETQVYTNIYGQRVVTQVTPDDFDLTVGAAVPDAVQVYEVPATVQYEPVRQYRYVTVGNRVVLVEPVSRKIVRVLQAPSDAARDKTGLH